VRRTFYADADGATEWCNLATPKLMTLIEREAALADAIVDFAASVP